MKQISECVGKLNVADINADRSWLLFEYLNSTAGDFYCRSVLLLLVASILVPSGRDRTTPISARQQLALLAIEESWISQPSTMFYKY